MITAVLLFHGAIAYSGGGGPSGEGQSCDAVNICASGTCPQGMTSVAPPERTTAYTIRAGPPGTATVQDRTSCVRARALLFSAARAWREADSKRPLFLTAPPPPSSAPPLVHSPRDSYVPGETVSIFIKTETQRLQMRKRIGRDKGVGVCYCDYPYRGESAKACGVPYNPKATSIKVVDGVSYPGPIACTEKVRAAAPRSRVAKSVSSAQWRHRLRALAPHAPLRAFPVRVSGHPRR